MRCLLSILLFFAYSQAQVEQQLTGGQKEDTLVVLSDSLEEQQSGIVDVFRRIEQGIRINTSDEYENDLASTVSITIGSDEHGCFSLNQAVSVLAGYFSGKRPIAFEFSRIDEKSPEPYAIGRLIYVHKGNQESAQVYVSLRQEDNQWVISQFNIY